MANVPPEVPVVNEHASGEDMDALLSKIPPQFVSEEEAEQVRDFNRRLAQGRASAQEFERDQPAAAQRLLKILFPLRTSSLI